MISKALETFNQTSLQKPALIYGTDPWTYQQVYQLAEGFVRSWQGIASGRVGVVLSSPVDLLAAVIALDRLSAHAFLVGERTESLAALATDLQWNAVIKVQKGSTVIEALTKERALPSPLAQVSLLTSGTTGKPKVVCHTWETLSRPVRLSPTYEATVWFSSYPLHLYAGLQVLLQTFLNAATLVLPKTLQPAEAARTLLASGAAYATGTPTFWRQLLFFGPQEWWKKTRLKQLTLGGEAVDQGLLDRLKAVFPNVRIVHIFASSELGRCFSVADEKSGFPAAWLEQSPDKDVELDVRDSELYVRSLNRMMGYDRLSSTGAGPDAEGWFPTGDMVEIRNGRVYFLGRKDVTLNVGGHKVYPGEIEAFVAQTPGVVGVRCYGHPSPLTGQVVGVDAWLQPGMSEDRVREEIQGRAHRLLPTHKRPRVIRFVASLEIDPSGKLARRI